MAEAPIRAFRFVHTAIRREVEAIASDARKLSSPADAEKLAHRIAEAGETNHLHTSGEEKGLFPRVADKMPGNEAHYLFDHTEERQLTKDAEQLARKIAAGDDSPAVREELRTKTAALCHHISHHMNKEESIILPLIEQHYSPAEQGQILGAVMSVNTPESMKKTIPWLINWLDPEDRVLYVGKMMAAMPPPVFANAKGWMRDGLPGDVWAELQRRIPELAS